MRVLEVQLRDFRTYARARAPLGRGLTIVHGANGAGKSNLLEAVYFGCTGRSPRTRNERELVRFDQRAARVSVRLGDGHDRHELTVGIEPPEKRMSCDGAPVERLLDLECRPLVSVFMPDRLELLKGAPAVRRAHLDQVVAGFWPARDGDRRTYARTLAQRNSLLARIRSGAASRGSMPTWDLQLARHALALRDNRARAVSLLDEDFAERSTQLGLNGTATLEYRPRTRARDEQELLAELESRLDSDLDRGFSGHGPHRDELALLRDGRELRVYGSQGEQRLAVLALLLAERSALARERGRIPLMLLDDVMSELDPDRRELLSGELSQAGQSVIATADLAHVPVAAGGPVTRLRVSTGSIAHESAGGDDAEAACEEPATGGSAPLRPGGEVRA